MCSSMWWIRGKKIVATTYHVCCDTSTNWALKQRLAFRSGNQCNTPLARVLVVWRSKQGSFQMCLICIGTVGSPHPTATTHLEWNLVSPTSKNSHLSCTCNYWLRCRWGISIMNDNLGASAVRWRVYKFLGHTKHQIPRVVPVSGPRCALSQQPLAGWTMMK